MITVTVIFPTPEGATLKNITEAFRHLEKLGNLARLKT